MGTGFLGRRLRLSVWLGVVLYVCVAAVSLAPHDGETASGTSSLHCAICVAVQPHLHVPDVPPVFASFGDVGLAPVLSVARPAAVTNDDAPGRSPPGRSVSVLHAD